MNKCLVCIDVYTVAAGDTLYSIAQRYNVSVGLLMRANMIDNPYDLRIGLKLCIPGFEDELPVGIDPGPVPLPTPSLPAQPVMPEMPCEPDISKCKGTVYTVQSGDTLYMIAKKHRVNLNAIIEMNPHVDPYNLKVGMQLCIPR